MSSERGKQQTKNNNNNNSTNNGNNNQDKKDQPLIASYPWVESLIVLVTDAGRRVSEFGETLDCKGYVLNMDEALKDMKYLCKDRKDASDYFDEENKTITAPFTVKTGQKTFALTKKTPEEVEDLEGRGTGNSYTEGGQVIPSSEFGFAIKTMPVGDLKEFGDVFMINKLRVDPIKKEGDGAFLKAQNATLIRHSNFKTLKKLAVSGTFKPFDYRISPKIYQGSVICFKLLPKGVKPTLENGGRVHVGKGIFVECGALTGEQLKVDEKSQTGNTTGGKQQQNKNKKKSYEYLFPVADKELKIILSKAQRAAASAGEQKKEKQTGIILRMWLNHVWNDRVYQSVVAKLWPRSPIEGFRSIESFLSTIRTYGVNVAMSVKIDTKNANSSFLINQELKKSSKEDDSGTTKVPEIPAHVNYVIPDVETLVKSHGIELSGKEARELFFSLAIANGVFNAIPIPDVKETEDVSNGLVNLFLVTDQDSPPQEKVVRLTNTPDYKWFALLTHREGNVAITKEEFKSGFSAAYAKYKRNQFQPSNSFKEDSKYKNSDLEGYYLDIFGVVEKSNKEDKKTYDEPPIPVTVKKGKKDKEKVEKKEEGAKQEANNSQPTTTQPQQQPAVSNVVHQKNKEEVKEVAPPKIVVTGPENNAKSSANINTKNEPEQPKKMESQEPEEPKKRKGHGKKEGGPKKQKK